MGNLNALHFPASTKPADLTVIGKRPATGSVPGFRVNWLLILGVVGSVGAEAALFWMLAWKFGGAS